MTYRQHLAQVVRKHGPAPDSAVIVSLIEEALRRRNDADNVDRDNSRAHVSDSGKCPRQVYRKITGNAETFTTDSLINFGVGRSVEEWFAETLEALGARVYREVAVEIPNPYGGPDVSGHIDFLVVIPPSVAARLGIITDKDIVVELKSINSRSMGWMLKKNEPGKVDHRKQIRLYHYAADHDAPAILDHDSFDLGWFAEADWYLVYVVKDATKGEPNIHAFLQEYDDDEALADLRSLSDVNALAAQKSEPPIPEGYAWKGYPCSYCSHRADCFGRSS